MTTETDLAALQLLCAEKLSGLRRECEDCKEDGHDQVDGQCCTCAFCDGLGWAPETRLPEAMVAVVKDGLNFMVRTFSEAESGLIFEVHFHSFPVHYADTPDLAFWTALLEALERSE